MNIIVTGAAGFIGSAVTKRLSETSHEIFAVDNLHTGVKENLAGLENVKFFNSEAGSLGDLNLPFIDYIFHLGMPSSAPMYLKDPGLEGKTVEEFKNILEFSKTSDSKIVFASTSSLYGGLDVPHKESMKVKPFDGYTRARFRIEQLAREHSKESGLDSIGLRFFSVYGPGEKSKGRYANILSQFMWSIQKDERPQIYGDGTQTRDFIFVSDVVDALFKALEYNGSGIFNVGTGVQTSFNQIIDMLNKALGRDIKPLYVGNPIKNYVYHTHADCRKAREVLGFDAEYSLESGIKELVKG